VFYRGRDGIQERHRLSYLNGHLQWEDADCAA